MNGILKVGPSTEGKSMDKLRDLANGERRHISITDARAIVSLFEEMRVKVGSLTMQLDRQYGTPCAQIRWQQEREDLQAALTSIRDDAANAVAYIEETDIEARFGTIIYYADKALGHVGPVL